MTEAHSVHLSHPEILKRLKRATGHLQSIAGMIEAKRPCLELAQQLHAVERAICEARRTLIQDHLDHCLDDVVGPLPHDKRRSLDEFKAISRYL